MSDNRGRWADDPYGRHQLRYWDGTTWTGHVSDSGVQAYDEPVARPAVQVTTADGIWWSSAQRAVTYFGSHPRLVGEQTNLTIGMVQEGFFILDSHLDPGVSLPWQDVDAVLVESASQVQSRVTATRVLLLGVFALMARKQTRTAFLSVRDRAGEWVFGIDGIDSLTLWTQLMPVSVRVPSKFGNRPGEPPMQTSPAGDGKQPLGIKERLVRLEELRSSGLIDDGEFASRRAAILAET